MIKLIIGDSESIKARDAGRIEAWKPHFEMELSESIKEHCPMGCREYTCKGPEVAQLHDRGIIWRCKRYLDTCNCCGQDMDIDLPETDFQGNDIGFTMSSNRKPFNPELCHD